MIRNGEPINFYGQILSRETPLIIAEIGAKYADTAMLLESIKLANDSGANMVKFQTYTAENLAPVNSYFEFDDGTKVLQHEYFKKYELSYDDHIEINKVCNRLGIPWTSTPSHKKDLDLLEKFDLQCYKTGSDDLTNLPFLKKIAETGKVMIVSTGMSTLGEIEQAIKTISTTGNNQIILLHCVVSYPSMVEDANLKVIQTLQSAFGFPVGLSDHTQDEFTSILATQMGAKVIEKHFTINHELKHPDHEASLDPRQFKVLVRRVNQVRDAMGSSNKKILDVEERWRAAARKSLFAAVDIPIHTILKEEHIEIFRPATGLHPHLLPQVLGRKSSRNISAGELLDWTMF